ncbi:lipopolysaccharide biosynthesis protein [Streptococcus pneumoniae]|uniref:lipopolysaccharide biosynthesis protein n=1 Tax=Streptococcus pneumoniae TaxID=1313 RepID=UPI0005E30635|nr:oligosaccharide flippase family protein [Streptococcus pneumoniae]CIQ85598.1 flippase Wzx [Streptococcus pneumoniae]CIX91683.1 flippase Wzx [Streptococcus pneumoniae]CIZ01659.1 flippase Wzx [Streptococcus pneumoniae]CJE94238.1 flippase Wzx [Streptococcus pneumoniae]CJH06125.1 flippase Wzx [Streptococcus pneumoniae]
MKKILNKYYSLSNPVKASIWFTICNVLQKGISMITVPVFTRVLTTEQYGVYSVYQSWYSIIGVFATLNLYYGVFNNGMIKYEKDKNVFTSSMQGLTTTVTAIFLLIYLIGIDFWNSLLGLPTLLILVMFFDLFFTPAYSFWVARQRFEYKYRNLVFITFIIAIGSPIIGISAVVLSTYKAEARVISFVLVQSCIGLYFYILNLYRGKHFFCKKYWLYALNFNLPLIPHYLSQSVLNQSDRIMINSMVGMGEAAIYSVAYSISILMLLVTSAINSSFIPYTYKCIRDKKYTELGKSANLLITLVGIGSILTISLGPEIIQLFAPKQYYEAIWIIPPVALSVYFMFLYPIFGNIEFYFEANHFVMWASIGGAIMNIFLNFIFLKHFGYIAAGYTTLFCYILFALGHYIFMRRVLYQNLSGIQIYNSRYILLFSILLIILMLLIVIIYPFILIRYLTISLILGGCFLKRKKIMSSIAIIKQQ